MPYVYVNDICGDAGVSLGALSLWTFSCLTTIIAPFLILHPSIGITGKFLVFSGMNVMGTIFCIFVLKETKGLSDTQCNMLYSSTAKN